MSEKSEIETSTKEIFFPILKIPNLQRLFTKTLIYSVPETPLALSCAQSVLWKHHRACTEVNEQGPVQPLAFAAETLAAAAGRTSHGRCGTEAGQPLSGVERISVSRVERCL